MQAINQSEYFSLYIVIIAEHLYTEINNILSINTYTHICIMYLCMLTTWSPEMSPLNFVMLHN